MEKLDIDSVSCVTESDKQIYLDSAKIDRSELEIPVSFRTIGYNNLEQIEDKSRPFVVPDKAYLDELGLMSEFAKPENYKTFEII